MLKTRLIQASFALSITAGALVGFSGVASAHTAVVSGDCNNITVVTAHFPAGESTVNLKGTINGQTLNTSYQVKGPGSTKLVPITNFTHPDHIGVVNYHQVFEASWTADGGGHSSLDQTIPCGIPAHTPGVGIGIVPIECSVVATPNSTVPVMLVAVGGNVPLHLQFIVEPAWVFASPVIPPNGGSAIVNLPVPDFGKSVSFHLIDITDSNNPKPVPNSERTLTAPSAQSCATGSLSAAGSCNGVALTVHVDSKEAIPVTISGSDGFVDNLVLSSTSSASPVDKTALKHFGDKVTYQLTTGDRTLANASATMPKQSVCQPPQTTTTVSHPTTPSTAAPTGQLPFTGSSSAVPHTVDGLVAAAAGSALILIARRRRHGNLRG